MRKIIEKGHEGVFGGKEVDARSKRFDKRRDLLMERLEKDQACPGIFELPKDLIVPSRMGNDHPDILLFMLQDCLCSPGVPDPLFKLSPPSPDPLIYIDALPQKPYPF